MGRWTYYAPLWLGTLLAAGLYAANLAQLTPWPVWVHVVAVVVGAPLVGLGLQLGLIGAQGAFAQVLPVPWGRSIRGGGAVLAGSLLWFALGLICALLRSEGLGIAALVVGALALASLVAAVVVYVWHVPAAVRDFGREH